jgi:hypothetical protein
MFRLLALFLAFFGFLACRTHMRFAGVKKTKKKTPNMPKRGLD